MLNTSYTEMLQEKDVIFEIFAYATKRRAEVGAENVFDFSLGNPSVPAPKEVTDAICRITQETDPLALHSYSPAGGIPSVRAAIAADLNRRFDMHYEGRHIFMTCGAAAALAHAIRAVTNPGDTVLTFAPCFSEYKPYVEGTGCKLRVVPADTKTFQISFDALEEYLTADVTAVLINSPNNPSGAIYSPATLQRLSEVLTAKAAAYGHPIFLISDEPYRDILFGRADTTSPVAPGRDNLSSGVQAAYPAALYPDTLTCYSFSKSLSLPGERIGYVAVGLDSPFADRICELLPQVSRTTGHNGAASLLQRVVAECCHLTADLSVYEKNKNLLSEALRSYGYEFVEPGGTFYMFPRSLEANAKAFCRRAMEHDLMLVPGDGFGCPGHFRIAYCVPTEQVEKALPVFQRLAEEYRK